MAHIYLIRNLINGKGYVGQTITSVERRFSLHKTGAAKGSRLALHCAMRKYGVQNFSVVELATCDRALLNDLEEHYIKTLGTFIGDGDGYNMTSGGDAPERVSVQTRQKQSLARMGKIPWNKGKRYKAGPRSPVPIDVRRKISEALTGRKNPSYIRSAPSYPCSEETKKKISEAKLGKYKGIPWTEARRMAQKARTA